MESKSNKSIDAKNIAIIETPIAVPIKIIKSNPKQKK